MKKPSYCFFLLIFLFLLLPASLRANEDGSNHPDKIGTSNMAKVIESRYQEDKVFKAFVELMTMTGIGSLFLGTFLTALIGLRQSVLWSFIGGYTLGATAEFFLLLFFRIGFGAYGFWFAFLAGITWASFVYRKKARDSGYGHKRHHAPC